jgi:hypothetical protein
MAIIRTRLYMSTSCSKVPSGTISTYFDPNPRSFPKKVEWAGESTVSSLMQSTKSWFDKLDQPDRLDGNVNPVN